MHRAVWSSPPSNFRTFYHLKKKPCSKSETSVLQKMPLRKRKDPRTYLKYLVTDLNLAIKELINHNTKKTQLKKKSENLTDPLFNDTQ